MCKKCNVAENGESCFACQEHGENELLPCPFCGGTPQYPDGDGTSYDLECDCGMARSCIQICDLMTIEERQADDFKDYRYGEEFIQRAREYVTMFWNTRAG